MIKKAIKTKQLADLEVNDCRWPIGDPRDADFHFCAANKPIDRPYCDHHAEMAVAPARPRTPAQSMPRLLIKRAA